MSSPFSRLASSFQVQTNRLYQTRDRLIAQGRTVVDLISGNVTEHGLQYPSDRLEPIVLRAARATRTYRPDPLGRPEARDAIAHYYRARGVRVDADQILITPGTSLAYWYAFSMLCDPGDEILTPSPSYPLFDEIAKLAGIRLTSYRLDERHGWAIDLDDLERRISGRTRAIVLISPHHPTGAVVSESELSALADLAAQRVIPLIADEVFGEFLFDLDRLPRPADTDAPLVITLDGFSKLFALPGAKLGWMALSGDPDLVRSALTALEAVSDALLPVNDLMQAAAPDIFEEGAGFLDDYRAEITRRRNTMLDALAASPRVSVVPPQGGFYAAVRVDTTRDDDDLAVHLIESAECLVHPGFFYDLAPTHLVLSLITQPHIAQPAVARLLAHLD